MKVSVIIPCYNEQKYIRSCVESLAQGLANVAYGWEILVIDGGSTDGTKEELDALASHHSGRVRVLNNPHRYQVHALNIGIGAALGEIIVRCDAHSNYPCEYIQELVSLTEEAAPNVGNVGTPHVGVPGSNTAMARCIAYAMSSKLAVGVSHRSVKTEAPVEVDTLLFGAWKKDIFEKVGLFDTRFIRGQDLEHNLRIRAHGFKVVLNPGVPFKFYTRQTLGKVCRMVYQYAAGKIEIKRHTGLKLSTRPFIPLLFFLAVAFTQLLPRPLNYTLSVAYLSIVFAYSIATALRKRSLEMLLLLAVIPSMHLSHACGTASGLAALFARRGHPRQWGGTR